MDTETENCRKAGVTLKQYADLHLHSTWSDGIHSPADLVAMAAARGLRAIAIADHDSVDGIDEALVAGARLAVEVVPALELSVEYGRFRDVHLLGYFIDHRDNGLRVKLAEFRKRRDERGHTIIDRVNKRLARQGKGRISHDKVQALAGGALGRPHIAQALVAGGYARTIQHAFENYLIPCDVPKQYFPMNEALAEIARVKGISVLAHPQSITRDRGTIRDIVAELAGMGLDGLEAFNNMCFDDDMIFLEALAASLNLIISGGSDFHGFEDDVEIGTGRGGLAVACRLVEAMKRRRDHKYSPHALPPIP
jgi:predicted metal-dependent phosphoesterase TrpH